MVQWIFVDKSGGKVKSVFIQGNYLLRPKSGLNFNQKKWTLNGIILYHLHLVIIR